MADTTAEKIAKDFSRFGWVGLWTQLALAIIPVFMLCYVLFGKATGNREAFDFTEYLALVGVAILAFTTFWSYRYVLLSRKVADPANRPPRDKVTKVIWVGVWASCVGIVVSLLLLFIETVRLLILFLRAPQAGVPVIQTQAESRTDWVSAIDAVSLLAEVCTLTGELLVLGLSLWLLFKVTRSANDYDQSVTIAKS